MIDLNDDFEVLAATLYGEARSEPLLGKQAVACVILNRVALSDNRPQFGDGTIAGACLEPWQFSCWNDHDPNRARLIGLDFTKPAPALAACIAVAEDAIAGKLTDPTQGCCFYKVTTLPWPRDWGKQVAPTVTIGHHSFYKLP